MSEFIVEDGGGVRRVPIEGQMTIGRSWNNDLVLRSVVASRRHAWVWQQGGQVIIEDLGSTHGTLVNGQVVTFPRFLNHNDVITIGDAQLTFLVVHGPSDEEPLYARSTGQSCRDADQTPARGVPRLMASQLFCPQCNAPNYPKARFCARCGYALGWQFAYGPEWRERGQQRWPGHPITPMEPVAIRPFPVTPLSSKAGVSKGVWVMILLLIILAIMLLTILSVLVAYTLT